MDFPIGTAQMMNFPGSGEGDYGKGRSILMWTHSEFECPF